MYDEKSSELAIHSGVRQGSPLFPVLLNYAIDWTMSNAVTGYPGVQLSPSVYVMDLGFGNAAVVLGDSPVLTQVMLDRITLCSAKVGLEINMKKTKTFSTFPISGVQQVLTSCE